MLPFIKRKEASVAGLIIKNRAPDEKPAEDQSDDPAAAIESCAEELIRAVHARDVKAVSAAIKDAFDILESMPHDENENNSFASQNEKAAQEERE